MGELNEVIEMTNAELVKRIVKKGCILLRHGGNHDLYINPATGGVAPILRHWTQQVNAGTLASIKKLLGLNQI